MRGKPGAGVGAVLGDTRRQGGQTVVPALVVQLVQQLDADDSTVGLSGHRGARECLAHALGPLEAVGFEQHAPAVDVVGVERRPHAQVGHTGQRWRLRRRVQPVHLHDEDAAGGGLPVVEAQVERAKAIAETRGRFAQGAAQLAPVHDVAADRVRAPEQRRGARHVARGQRLAHRGAGHAPAVDLVAEHARHVEAACLARGVQQRVVAAALRAEAKVIADEHITRVQRPNQHVVDERLGRQRRERLVEGQDHAFVDTAAAQLRQLVAQRGNARRRQLRAAVPRGEEVPRVRLERHGARGHAAVTRLVDQQRQHRLMAAVHAVEIADRQRPRLGGSPAQVVQAVGDVHGRRGGVMRMSWKRGTMTQLCGCSSSRLRACPRRG
ncbi:hypothetical protein Ttaiw_01618 [Tepidimonas taiwanensis]|uniref:Uncharacterized protein n=1 Tax=Tepidimonas taiwanensis TaxID=307486 RepID=A0A554X5X5_9BURK|nr:hypothetical protein Ttaiw_01618 [Tepidimonas taiwanensis]